MSSHDFDPVSSPSSNGMGCPPAVAGSLSVVLIRSRYRRLFCSSPEPLLSDSIFSVTSKARVTAQKALKATPQSIEATLNYRLLLNIATGEAAFRRANLPDFLPQYRGDWNIKLVAPMVQNSGLRGGQNTIAAFCIYWVYGHTHLCSLCCL